MNNFPLFTIFIPTKDRSKYLYHTLRTCTEQTYPNLEIIVADDASTDDTVEVVNRMAQNDPRIKLIARKKRVGMRDNFEMALDLIKPGYVIALGGDDGLIPDGIMSMYKIMKDTNTELLTWCPPVYEYPSERNPKGQFSIYRHKGIRVDQSNTFLDRQTKKFNYVNDIECPMFYVKGVVSTRLIDRVKSRSRDGRFYSCPTPDGYSGIVLAGEVENYIFSGEAFSIYGVSSSSQGLVYLSNEKEAKANSDEFFNFTKEITMHSELANQPYSPLLSLMTVDYLLTARDLPGWPGKFSKINYRKMLDKAIRELSSCRYGEERIEREIHILYEIAKKHELEDYFKQQIKQSKRYGSSIINIESAISPNMLYINPEEFQICNIYDAAYASKYIYKMVLRLNTKSIFKILKNSYKIFSAKKKIMGDFPDVNL